MPSTGSWDIVARSCWVAECWSSAFPVTKTKARRRWRRSSRGASSFSWEKRYLRADGTTTWVRINLSLLSHSEKVFAATVEDINERRRTEAQLRDKMRLIARAHELAKIGPF